MDHDQLFKEILRQFFHEFMLLHCLDSYLELGRQEVPEYDRLLAEPVYEEANQMATSFLTKALDEGRKEGRKEGRREGRREGRAQSVLELTRLRFGRVPRAVSQRVKAATDEDELISLMAEIAAAESPTDLSLKS